MPMPIRIPVNTSATVSLYDTSLSVARSIYRYAYWHWHSLELSGGGGIHRGGCRAWLARAVCRSAASGWHHFRWHHCHWPAGVHDGTAYPWSGKASRPLGWACLKAYFLILTAILLQ